jgi:hypothetical protein
MRRRKDMTNPHNGNGGSPKRTPDDDEYPRGIFAAAHRDPEAAAIALIAAVDRFLSSGCPLHPEPLLMELDERIEGTLSAGVNCHICNSSY